jgi:ribosomal protein S18 acetylase RimI-like enzyme
VTQTLASTFAAGVIGADGHLQSVPDQRDGHDASEHMVGVLRDDRPLFVRDLQPDDLPAARVVNLALSARSSYLRYFGTFSCASSGEIHRIVAASPNRISLLGLIAGVPVALAELDAIGEPAGCEMALSVSDAYQGLGIGTLLLAELAHRAALRGVSRLRADVLHNNAAMLALLRHSGLPMTLTLARDVDQAMLSVTPDRG